MPKKQRIKTENDDDTESFHNSEDEYFESENTEDTELSGGDDGHNSATNELGDDSNNLEIDPDDQIDPDRDEKYDEINDTREEEDPENAEDREDPADYESAGSAVEEEEYEASAEEGAEELEQQDEEYDGETKQCHLKNLNKDFIVLDEDDSSMYGKMEYTRIKDEDRETDPIMTYYEMVRIIGTRAQQFNFGANALINGVDGLHSAKKAYVELMAKMTPFIIRRHLPGKKYEDWRIDELEIIHTITDSYFVPENFDYNMIVSKKTS